MSRKPEIFSSVMGKLQKYNDLSIGIAKDGMTI